MADTAKLKGDHGEANRVLLEAFRNEAQAARLVPDDPSSEPSRSILYRSAASLAIECGKYVEAVELILAGLAGDPPAEIADELQELVKTIRES